MQYSSTDGKNWQKAGSAEATERLTLKDMLEKGGSLKIGDASVAVNNKMQLIDNFSQIKSTLETLEPSDPTVRALTNDLKNEYKGALERSEASTAREISKIKAQKASLNPISRLFKSKGLQQEIEALEQYKSNIQQKLDKLNIEKEPKIQDPAQGHPHLGGTFALEIREVLHPDPTEGPKNMKALNEATYQEWVKEGLVDSKGRLDFTKLGLSSSEIRKAGLKGKIWIGDDGKPEMSVKFQFGDAAVHALWELKNKINTEFEPSGPNSPMSVNPELARELSKADQEILARGGQIQFRSLANGETLKLILDPGKDGEGDGLTVTVLDRNCEATKTSEKIPLSAVFEGQAYKEIAALKDGHPILEGWRKQDFFAKSAIQEKVQGLPFTSRFDRITESNEDDVGRLQTENTLWNAVYEYLGITSGAGNNPSMSANEVTPIKSDAQEIPQEGLNEVKRSDLQPVGLNASVNNGDVLPDDFDNLNTKDILNANAELLASKDGLKDATNKNIAPIKAGFTRPVLNPSKIGDILGAAKNLSDNLQGLVNALRKPTNPEADKSELYSNPLFLSQVQKNNPELYETLTADKTQAILNKTRETSNGPTEGDFHSLLDLARDVSAALSQFVQTQQPPEEPNSATEASQIPAISAGERSTSSTLKSKLLEAARNLDASINNLTGNLRQATIGNSGPQAVQPNAGIVSEQPHPDFLEQEIADVRSNLRHVVPNAGRTPPVDELTAALRSNQTLERAARLENLNSERRDNNPENVINNGSEATDEGWDDR